ncbi:hypothetical protein ABZP36_020300 [Zizania latifolia]
MAGQGSQMKKSCDHGKRYVDHRNGKMKCFHRKMGTNFRHCMIIPNKFLNHFGGKISKTIELESPKGNVHVVKVSKHMNTTALRCGWEAFVDAHHIQENDSLLFRHIDNSRFEVLVLDSDGCEKIFSCAGMKRASSVHGRSADPIHISGCPRDDDDTTESSGSERFVRCQRGSVSHQRRKTAKLEAMSSSSEESGEEGSESSASEHESSYEQDDPHTPSGPDYVLSRGVSLSKVQEQKVARLVHNIRPEIPVFVAIMKRSNVISRPASLVIPKHYASAHFPRTSQTITIQRRGKNRKWHPRFYIRNDGAGYILHGCWTDFVRDNHVEEGDICIFQPTEFTARKFRATVHLLRETKSRSFGASAIVASPKRVDSRDGRTRTRATGCRRVSRTEEGRRGTRGTSTSRVKEEPDDDRCNNNGQGMRQEPLDLADSGGSSKPLYMYSGKASLSREQVKKVEERARSIQSEVPIYVSIMSKSKIGTNKPCTMMFGKRYATGYLPDGEQTLRLVMVASSKAWQVRMLPRRGDARTLTTGWRGFVHDNRLQLQDICLFQLMNNEKRLTMTVYIIRRDGKL